MGYQSVTAISAKKIPVVDIAALFAEQPDYQKVGAHLIRGRIDRSYSYRKSGDKK